MRYGIATSPTFARASANPDAYFLIARFAEPTGYQNANCALFSIAFWPAFFLASRRQVPIVVRALMHNDDRRTTLFAVLVGLLLTVSPAILVLLGR